jgi:hypothetical protein
MNEQIPKLTADNVEKVLIKCLFKDGEDTSKAVTVKGVINQFGFHAGRLEESKAEIKTLLSQLPSDFKADGGGGTSFLCGCMTEDGDHWGEHRNMEQLFALGMATGQVKECLGGMRPGGMPYYCVL